MKAIIKDMSINEMRKLLQQIVDIVYSDMYCEYKEYELWELLKNYTTN